MNSLHFRTWGLAAAALAAGLTGCVMVDLSSLGRHELKEVTVEKAAGRFVSQKILLVDISGEIAEGADGGLFGGFVCSPHYLRAVLKKAEADEDVRAVVLRIDSPGGGVGASELMAREIREFRRRTGRPVFANVTGLGCSGAYYIASACDRIDAQSSSIVGSIGVIAMLPRVRKLADKVGIEMEIVKSGAMKDMGSFMREMTPEERAVFQGLIDADYNGFVEFVAAQRPAIGGAAQLRPLADGRVYTAAQALDHKLVDGIAFLDETVEAAKKKAGVARADVVSYAYGENADANLYTPAGSSRLPKLMNLDLPLPFRSRAGIYYLWMPGE